VGALRYGTVAINLWPAVGYGFAGRPSESFEVLGAWMDPMTRAITAKSRSPP